MAGLMENGAGVQLVYRINCLVQCQHAESRYWTPSNSCGLIKIYDPIYALLSLNQHNTDIKIQPIHTIPNQ